MSSNQCNVSPSNLAALKMGENSSVTIIDVTEENTKKIKIVCGNNCQISIQGIKILNNSFFVFANDNATFEMGPGQLFNGHFNFMLHEPSAIKIGSDCLWGSGELLTSDCHSILDLSTKARINPAKDITIGNRVWLGAPVKVLKGATIGNDTVIASGSIVTS
jgi:acetyltransferase-like isoleucine patch superfamily enzyme